MSITLKAVFLSLMLATLAHAETASSIEQLKSILHGSATFSANFRQVSIDKTGQPGQASFGKFYLSRPGKFRWNYEKPFEQEIVSNGGKVWYYDADLEQVTVRKLDDSLGATPALLLTGQVNIEEKFKLESQGGEDGLDWVKLSPRDEESGFKYILIGLNKGQLAGMELSDNFGQLTRIYFTDIRLNPGLNDALFEFKPPKGADVFGN
ncbi:MAG: outer membrane lipoprotein chaperone LolA [Methylococcales bacterium]|nr:outer membrane lipoprotein chaperone LolA [Methylococcales bacterium]